MMRFDSAEGARVQTTSIGSPVDNVFDGGASLIAWVAPDNAGEGGVGVAIGKDSGGSPRWYLRGAGTNKMEFLQAFSGTDGQWEFPLVQDGSLHLVVVTYNNGAVGNDPNVYVDGALVTETETATPTGTRTTDAGANICMGNSGASDAGFDGVCGGFELVVTTLTAAEVARLWETNGRFRPTRTLGRWLLDGGVSGVVAAEGAVLKDSSGYGHHATLQGGDAEWADGLPFGKPRIIIPRRPLASGVFDSTFDSTFN